MKKYFILFIFIIFSCASYKTGKPFSKSYIEYNVSFDNYIHHEAKIIASFYNLPQKVLQVRMSRTSPGRYALHEFAKNIYYISAFDSKRRKLKIFQSDPHQWNVSDHDGTVHFHYTLYGNCLDGTHCSITTQSILLNIPAAFVWARGLEDCSITINIKKPVKNWKILTQLKQTDKPDNFIAPNFKYFTDSPIAIGDFVIKTWERISNGKKYQFILAVNHHGTENAVDEFAKMIYSIADEQIAVFGELPDFDNRKYFFITNYVPHAKVDGMEHRNSCVVTRYNTLKSHMRKFLTTLSHEFFHCWNMERLRPKSLCPFDLSGTNMCSELWFAEGATVYYDDIFLVRAGIRDLSLFAYGLNLHLNRVLNFPSKDKISPLEISNRAALLDGAVYEDPLNSENNYISYYDCGDMLTMGLDLILRAKFKNITFDDFMRALWIRFGREEIPYTNEDLQFTLGELTMDQNFASDFFNNYVYGTKQLDYIKLLSYAGLLVRKKRIGRASLGDVVLLSYKRTAKIKAPTIIGTPLYVAGIDINDQIIRLGGTKITSAGVYYRVLNYYKPGDTVEITYSRMGKVIKSKITFVEDNEVEVVPYETAGIPVTDEIKEFRKKWLGSKAKR